MDYDMFETFIILCETGNITKTAELLYKTQPAISSRIQQLEDALGYTLIKRERGKKTIKLTSKGEEFLEIARKFMHLYGEIEEIRNIQKNSLMVSSIDSLNASITSDICNTLIEKYGTRISLLTYQTPDAYRMIADKQLDIAFVSAAIQSSGVICEPLFKLDYIIVKRTSNPGKPTQISINDLNPKTELYQRWNSEFEAWHHYRFGKDNYKIHVDSCATLKRFLHLPDSWAIIQRCNLAEISADIPVQVYTLPDMPPERICYMISSAYLDRINMGIIQKFKQTAYEYSKTNHFYYENNIYL